MDILPGNTIEKTQHEHLSGQLIHLKSLIFNNQHYRSGSGSNKELVT